jgi:pyridoxal phosphate enzyme (YggS family)
MVQSGIPIAQNVAEVRQRIAEAAARSGRVASDITLVAVTKYVGLPEIRDLLDAGCTDLGESRPQQLWEKAAALADVPICWHLIGHLQRNKVRRTVPLVGLMHSADSAPLIATVDQVAGDLKRRLPLLLEINISGDATKHGLLPDEVEPLLESLPTFRNIEVRGLMCMAALEGGLDAARRDFAALRTLRDRLVSRAPAQVSLRDLSMGMSGDYCVAIEEGATIVRVGSALFENRG